jgi:hypothetical protein
MDSFQLEERPYYWRVFETRDESFDYQATVVA